MLAGMARELEVYELLVNTYGAAEDIRDYRYGQIIWHWHTNISTDTCIKCAGLYNHICTVEERRPRGWVRSTWPCLGCRRGWTWDDWRRRSVKISNTNPYERAWHDTRQAEEVSLKCNTDHMRRRSYVTLIWSWFISRWRTLRTTQWTRGQGGGAGGRWRGRLLNS